MDERQYTDEEAEAILKHATRVEGTEGQVTSEKLRQMGAEIGLTPEQIKVAEDRYLQEKLSGEKLGQKGSLSERRKNVFKSFRASFGSWVGATVFLGGINLLTSPGEWWSLWPIGMFGFMTLASFLEGMIHPESVEEEERTEGKQGGRLHRDRETYVRNQQAEGWLDAHFASGGRRDDRLGAIRCLMEEHQMSGSDAEDAVNYYYRLRAW